MEEHISENITNSAQEMSELLRIRREKLSAMCEAGKDPYAAVKFDRSAYSTDVKENYSDYEEKEVALAGRMMSKRIMGKASFASIRDAKGDIQIYVRRDDVGEESYADFKAYDIGDIIVQCFYAIECCVFVNAQ